MLSRIKPLFWKVKVVLNVQISLIIMLVLGIIFLLMGRLAMDAGSPQETRNRLCMAYDNYTVAEQNRVIPALEKLCAIQ